MEELPIDLILNSEPAFYLDWKGAAIGLALFVVITWGLCQN